MKAVLDTNVLISGIYFCGLPGKILEAWGVRRFQLLVSTEILQEHLNVAEGCCQVNDIRAAQRIDGFIPLLFGQHLGAGHLMPFTKCPRAKLAIVNRSRQVPTQPEQIAHHTINRKKALRLPR